ncbi:putative BOI-related E3 ubiquitin-protein ligase 3 [Bienertia sinuspersici]
MGRIQFNSFLLFKSMFGANDANPMLPVSMEGVRLPYNATMVPSMQLDVLLGCNADIMNMVGDKNTSMMNLPDKTGRCNPNFSPLNFPSTSYENFFQNEPGQSRNTLKQIPVSTGLKLSYGEDEPNSSISSAGEGAMANLSSLLSHNDNLQSEFARQSDEFDQFIRIQEENIKKGITELKHRHTVSLLNALEKEVNCRMHEKDMEIENLNQKNKELTEKIRQVSVEAHSWHLRAKQNESLVNVLRNNINQVFLQQQQQQQQGDPVLKEGCGDSMADDAVSSCNQNIAANQYQNNAANQYQYQYQNHSSSKELVSCKACRSKEVSILILPCRHLCLCIECDGFTDICPVCRIKKGGSLQVYMS